MPYIAQDQRLRLDALLDPLVSTLADKAELTYALFYLARRHAERGESRSWGEYADAIAALECSKLDLYVEQVSRHERGKRAANGDVGAAGAITPAGQAFRRFVGIDAPGRTDPAHVDEGLANRCAESSKRLRSALATERIDTGVDLAERCAGEAWKSCPARRLLTARAERAEREAAGLRANREPW